MTRDQLIAAVVALPGAEAPQGYCLFIIETDDAELDAELQDDLTWTYETTAFCETHAPGVARIETLLNGASIGWGVARWGEDKLYRCAYHDCGVELDTGSLTDSAIDDALALTETNPFSFHITPYELAASARSMMRDDPRWSTWEAQARRALARHRRSRHSQPPEVRR